uniref:hypothetical protein n=1 Tax=Cupriavidus necator TaxID=106590 RepID=UPI003F49619A
MQVGGKVYLIVDGHPVHRSAAAKQFVYVKTNAMGKSRPRQQGRADQSRSPPFAPPAEAASCDSEPVQGEARLLRGMIKITHYLLAPSVKFFTERYQIWSLV